MVFTPLAIVFRAFCLMRLAVFILVFFRLFGVILLPLLRLLDIFFSVAFVMFASILNLALFVLFRPFPCFLNQGLAMLCIIFVGWHIHQNRIASPHAWAKHAQNEATNHGYRHVSS